MKTAFVVFVAYLCFVGCTDSNRSPYVGETARDITSLSADEISGFLSGAGMGFAKIAELNGYPGPKHVLEMADDLALTAVQQDQAQAIFERMNSEATRLGEELVEVERSLDAQFARGSPDTEATAFSIARSAELRGRIRIAHVMAHFEMMDILTQHQVNMYIQQRGYSTGHEDHADHRGHRM